MDAFELDRRFRAILAAVTPATSLSSTQALVALGIGPRAAFAIICKALEAAQEGSPQ